MHIWAWQKWRLTLLTTPCAWVLCIYVILLDQVSLKLLNVSFQGLTAFKSLLIFVGLWNLGVTGTCLRLLLPLKKSNKFNLYFVDMCTIHKQCPLWSLLLSCIFPSWLHYHIGWSGLLPQSWIHMNSSPKVSQSPLRVYKPYVYGMVSDWKKLSVESSCPLMLHMQQCEMMLWCLLTSEEPCISLYCSSLKAFCET